MGAIGWNQLVLTVCSPAINQRNKPTFFVDKCPQSEQKPPPPGRRGAAGGVPAGDPAKGVAEIRIYMIFLDLHTMCTVKGRLQRSKLELLVLTEKQVHSKFRSRVKFPASNINANTKRCLYVRSSK